MTSTDIANAAQQLVAQGGVVALCARSIVVRASAYAALSAKGK